MIKTKQELEDFTQGLNDVIKKYIDSKDIKISEHYIVEMALSNNAIIENGSIKPHTEFYELKIKFEVKHRDNILRSSFDNEIIETQ